MGGSHGGFLTGHLVGQHGERFRTGVLQNPVMDLSGFIHDTDIPDWCYIEAFGVEVGACVRSSLGQGRASPSANRGVRMQEGRRRMAARPTQDDLLRFRSVSPVAHVDKVSVPLLFILGGKDRRRALLPLPVLASLSPAASAALPFMVKHSRPAAAQGAPC